MNKIDRKAAEDILFAALRDPEPLDTEAANAAMAFTGYMAMEIGARGMSRESIEIFGLGMDGWMEALARRARDLTRLLFACLRDPELGKIAESMRGVDRMYEWRVVEPFGVCWARSLTLNGEEIDGLRHIMVDSVLDWLEGRQKIDGWRIGIRGGKEIVVNTESMLHAIGEATKELKCYTTDIDSMTRLYR